MIKNSLPGEENLFHNMVVLACPLTCSRLWFHLAEGCCMDKKSIYIWILLQFLCILTGASFCKCGVNYVNL